MTPLISARRAAEDFARVVDGSPADVADRFADLTTCVDYLRAQPAPAARPEFVVDLRSRLMAAADSALLPVEPALAPVITLQPIRRRERRIAAMAAAFVIVGGTAGVAAAAEKSLPGDALYPIKRSIESAQVSLNTSDTAKGQDLIDQASTRLHEIDSLMNQGDSTSEITHTLASFKRSAADGADLLFVAYQRDGDTNALADLRSTLGEQTALLTELGGQAPSTARPDFTSASSLLSDLDQQARVLCDNCGPDSGTAFTNLSSAPALQSLLTQPAQLAADALVTSQATSLANAAGALAAANPKPSEAPAAETTRDATTPHLAVPTLPAQGAAVKTVTGGVEGLLDTVGDSTGGVLAPVTTTVNNTLDTLTQLLGQ